MPYWPPDTPPVAPGQMPAAPNSGPAPVPFGGDQGAGNPDWSPAAVDPTTPGPLVLEGVTGANYVSEAPLAAPNVNPYDPPPVAAIYTGGDDNPAGVDDVRATVAASVAAAEARFTTHMADTYAAGSTIGDLIAMPPRTSDGKITQGGGYYDPPRDYDGGQL
jgi:hypothetical protein